LICKKKLSFQATPNLVKRFQRLLKKIQPFLKNLYKKAKLFLNAAPLKKRLAAAHFFSFVFAKAIKRF
jgi:hypothetical protein